MHKLRPFSHVMGAEWNTHAIKGIVSTDASGGQPIHGESLSLANSALISSVSTVSSTVTIGDGGYVDIAGLGTKLAIFEDTTGTLKIDHSVSFTGSIEGLAGSDRLDLGDVNYGAGTKVTYTGALAGGTLTVTDGKHTAHLKLIGDYLPSSWTLSSDGHGGTIVVDPVVHPAVTSTLPSGGDSAWKPIDIGAGGYLTGIDIAPDDTMVVRTDTYGAYIWTGTQWRQLVTSASMPADASIPSNQGAYELRVAPSNSNILYMEYAGNVYRSGDKGTTWTKTAFAQVAESPNDSYRMNGQKMAVDPHNSNVVYVGTPQNGLWVTTDAGVTWNAVSGVPVSAPDSAGAYPGITGITFDPNSGVGSGKTKVLFASSYGHGVYESTNGGGSWTALSGGPQNVEYAALSNGVYYAVGDKNTDLWSYSNGTWSELLSNTSKGLHDVAIDPFNPAHIVVAAPGGALDQSFDGGKTWTGFNGINQFNATDIPWLANAGGYMSMGGLAFDQVVANKLWASDGIGVWNTSPPSTATSTIIWNSQNVGIEQLVSNQILVPPGGHPVTASWDWSFIYISDPGTYPSSHGVAGQPVFAAGWSVDYASSQPSFLVGIADWWGTEQSGYSTNGGQSWQVFPSFPAFAGKTIGGTIAASSPTDIIWAPAGGYAPYYTTNGGTTWNQITLPGVTNWSNFDFAYYLDRTTVTADRVLANTFYLYYDAPYPNQSISSGVYRSTDGGTNWTLVHSGEISSYSQYNAHIEAVPGEAGNLFFTGGPQGSASTPHPANEGFYQSADGGATWTAVPGVFEVKCFGFGKAATAGGYPSIYVVGWVNNTYGVWQSNDNAHSWTEIGQWPAGSLDQIKTISGDPNTYGEVYVGFAGSGYAYLPAANLSPSVTTAEAIQQTHWLLAGPGTTTVADHIAADTVVVSGTPGPNRIKLSGTAHYVVTGGGGADKITGGRGYNTFEYTTTSDSSQSAHDTITNFNVAHDNIDFSAIAGLNRSAQHVSIHYLTATPSSIHAHTIDVVTHGENATLYCNASNRIELISQSQEDMVIDLHGLHSRLTVSDFIFHG